MTVRAVPVGVPLASSNVRTACLPFKPVVTFFTLLNSKKFLFDTPVASE